MKTLVTLLFLTLNVGLFAQEAEDVNYDECYKMTSMMTIGDTTAYTIFACTSFISPNGITGCYQEEEAQIYIGGKWERFGENEFYIHGEVMAAYFILLWTDEKIVITLQNDQSTHFTFEKDKK
ncbi:MAG: hypothetical protein ABJG68_14595 [Crocinitomicaceae bacterium]